MGKTFWRLAAWVSEKLMMRLVRDGYYCGWNDCDSCPVQQACLRDLSS